MHRLPAMMITAVAASVVLLSNATMVVAQPPPDSDSIPLSRNESVRPAGAARLDPSDLQITPSGRDREGFLSKLSSNDARFEVIVGQGRLITLERDLVEPDQASPLIATGDPSVIDFEVVGPRHIRVTGQRIGVTDLSIVPSSGEAYHVEVHVVADLQLLTARLRQAFPDALLELSHLRDHIVVEGQARDSRQVARIIDMIASYMRSIQVTRRMQTATAMGPGPMAPAAPGEQLAPPADEANESDVDDLATDASPTTPPPGPLPRGPGDLSPDAARPQIRVDLPEPQIINLIQLPGPQQVMLQVQVAELNRTALRELDVNFLLQNQSHAISGNIAGNLGPGSPVGGNLLGMLNPLGAETTTFGVFDGGRVNFFVNALRRNQVFKILAEPTLVAMHGQEASFLSGGEFPVPVPQGGAAVGAITIQYREFGVGLTFVPYILDGDVVRLAVAPEVSSIDFTLGITSGGIQVPALNTRRTRTVVELQQGETLAVSGLLQVELEADTARIPGLGDLPHIGSLFRNTSSRRVEKELIILVTPHLVGAMAPDEVPPPPGSDVCEANDCELFLKGRIEGRTGIPYRSTTRWDDPWGLEKRRQVEQQYISGPFGYSN